MSIIDDLFGAVGLAKDNIAEGTGMLLGNSAKQSSLEDIISGIQSQAATDTATMTAQKGTAELQMQNARKKIANTFGTDINSQTELLTALSKTASDAYNDRDAALQDIKTKQSVTLFDNPLEYITNKFTINSDIARHNAADERLTNAETRIQQLNQDTDATIKTNNQIGESLTQASVEAATRNAAAAAQIEAAKSKIASIGYNNAGVNFVLGATKETLANSLSLYNAATSQEHLNQSMNSLDLQRQKFANEQEEFATKQQNVEDAKQFDSSLIANVNKGLAATGNAPLNAVMGKQVLTMMKGNSPLAKQYYDLYQIGNQSEDGKPVIATSIGNAAQILSEVPVKLTPAQQPVKDLIQSATQEFMRQHSTPGSDASKIDLKDKAAVSSGISAIGNAILQQKASNITYTDTTNPFNIGSLNQLGESSTLIQSLPLYQKVYAPKIATGVQLSDPKVIFQLAADAVSNKTISYNDALDLTTIYHVGVGINMASKQFSSLGIVAPATYKTSLDVQNGSNIFRNSSVVDLTKPDEVARALNFALVNKEVQNKTYKGSIADSFSGTGANQ